MPSDTIFSITNITNGTTYVSAFTCTAGPADNYTFNNFSLTATTGFPGNTNFSMGLGGGGTSAAAGILDFGYTLLTGSEDVRLVYSLTPGIPGMTLAVGTGGVSEIVCDSAGVTAGGSCLGSVIGSSGGSITGGNHTTITIGASSQDWIVKDIGSGGSEFSQSIIPEPMTLTLLGAGLLGLGALGRRRRLRK